jgi:hypothetical protein
MSIARHNRWLILLTGVLALAPVVYINRAHLARALIADSIYREHIFTPSPWPPSVSRWHRLREAAQFFLGFFGNKERDRHAYSSHCD